MTNRAGTTQGKRRNLYVTCLICLAGGAVAVGVALLALRPFDVRRMESHADVANDPGIEVASSTEPTESESRPVYRFSVIPGGAYSADDLAMAMVRDAVVEGEYGDVATDAVHAKVLEEPRQAYVSYRLNNRIYWTKKKVTLAAGETILSDGETDIRARCGNEISYEAMLPTLDSEPEPGELDQLVTGPTEAELGTVPPVIWGSRDTPDWSAVAAVLPGFFGLPGGTSGPAFPLDPVSLIPIIPGALQAPAEDQSSAEDQESADDESSAENPSVPSAGPDSDEDDTPNHPNKPGPPRTPPSPGNPLGPIDPLTPIDPLDPTDPLFPIDPLNPTDPLFPTDPFVPTEPLDPTDPLFPLYPPPPADPLRPPAPPLEENAPVVPEPSTILLLGTGGGALLVRKFRARLPINLGGRGKKFCAGGEKPA